MKTEKDLNADILTITMKIQETHPELSKFIGEMPVSMSYPEKEGMNLKSLKDYYDSLVSLLKKYHISHDKHSAGYSV